MVSIVNGLTYEWRRQGALLALFLMLLSVFYYPTFATMVDVWMVSDTYAHCFIILPICVWLIWRIRHQIAATKPQVNYLGIPLLMGLGVIWLFANYIGIQAAEHLAVTLMIPVLVFTLLGWQTTSVMLFPLAFLMFAVPIGEELTPALINFTADFTVALIQLVGIPVFREGIFFQLPTGNWSVVAACSGVRYLIASLCLGVLYAYLNYQSSTKRAVFILFAAIVPIIANGLRAFLIVMIGHFSGMELATGVDHLVYGWVFFGLVIGLMFYIGSYWQDSEAAPHLVGMPWKLGQLDSTGVGAKLAMLGATGVLLIWPVKIYFEHQEMDYSAIPQISVSAPEGWEARQVEENAWKPAYQSFDRQFMSAFVSESDDEVTVFVGYYAQQRQGAEIGNHNNVLVTEKDEVWRAIHGQTPAIIMTGITAPTVEIQGPGGPYLTSYFYYINGQWASNRYHATLLQAKARLFGGRNDGALIAITTPLQENITDTRAFIEQFMTAGLDDIKSGLDQL